MVEPAVSVDEPAMTRCDAVAGETVTESLSAVAEEEGPPLWLATMSADSALYNAIVPPAEETPFVNVIVVFVPKATADPVLFVTVGFDVASGAVFAPENVSVLSPL